MLGPALTPEIQQMLAEKDFATLKSALREFENADIGEQLEELPAEDGAMLFRLLGRDDVVVPGDVQEQRVARTGEGSRDGCGRRRRRRDCGRCWGYRC